jgi:Raf kinase inhibitor-like YbhB/YbcL family protein
MQVSSSAFHHGGAIPIKYTEDGTDVSPPLVFEDIPNNARSLALIVDDPDAPDPAAPRREPWVHWVLADIPPDTRTLPEGVTQLPRGTVGENDFHRRQWDGPAPKVGKHRYRFTLYALDQRLGLPAPSKSQLEQAMQDHVIARAELIGTYRRGKR